MWALRVEMKPYVNLKILGLKQMPKVKFDVVKSNYQGICHVPVQCL